MATARYIRTASGKTLPDHPDYDENVFRAVETEWLAHATREQFCARWVTVKSTGGIKRVQLQKDDGRGHIKRANPTAGPAGYHMLNALNGQPSLLILTVEDMAEAVYRHYIARDPVEEKTQKVFTRMFGAKYEGTREEDLNWIIRKIKLHTKEAAQGVLAPYNAPSSTFSQTANTASTHYAVQSASNSRGAINQASPSTPQSRRTPSTSTHQITDTPQDAFQPPYNPQATAHRISQTAPSQNQRSVTTATLAPAPSITATPARSVPADDFRGSLSDSRKRGTTVSMDFSERGQSRPRLSDIVDLTLSDYSPTTPTRHTPIGSNSANRSAIRVNSSSYLPSTNSCPDGGRGGDNADLVLPSKSGGTGPRTGPGTPVTISRMRAGKASTSEDTGASKSLNPVGRNGPIVTPTGTSNIAKKIEGYEYSGSSPLRTDKGNGQGNATSKTNGNPSNGKANKAEPGNEHQGSSKLDGRTQTRTEGTGKSGELSTSIIKGLNAQGSSSVGLKGPPAVGTPKVRKQDAFAGILMGAPTTVEKGARKGSSAVMGRSPAKANKGYGGGTGKPGGSFTTPVKPTVFLKVGAGGRNGPSAPGLSTPKDGKASSTPQGPTSSLSKGSNHGSGGYSTTGSRPRHSYVSGAPPGLNFEKKETHNRRYENKPIDSTAHLYNAPPDPEKYSDEWQTRLLGLGVSVGLTNVPDAFSPPFSKTQPVGSPGNPGGQPSSTAGKTRPVEPAGLIGILNTITNWPSGNMGSKAAANLSTPTRNVSGAGNAASNNNGTKATPTRPSGYRAHGVNNRNSSGPVGFPGLSARDMPHKTPGKWDSSVSKATPNRSPVEHSTPVAGNCSGTKWDTPKKLAGSNSHVNRPPLTGPRNVFGSSHTSGQIGHAPPTGPRSYRARSPHGDSYRPAYTDLDGSRVYGRYEDASRSDQRSGSGGYDASSEHRSGSGGYDSRFDRRSESRSGQQSPHYFDSRSRSGYDDRQYGSLHRY